MEGDENKDFERAMDHLAEGFQLISFDWRYKYVNDAVVKQSKYTREELLGFTMMEKYPGIEETEMFSVLRRCMRERVADKMENEFEFPDGSKGWFELSIQPVPEGIFIISMDVTERKKAELGRQEQLKKLQEIMFMTSHKVRQPVAHILGVAHVLDDVPTTLEELQKISNIMKEAATSLDICTKELAAFVYELHVKARES